MIESVKYPLHEVQGEIIAGTSARLPSTFHQLLMLPEQIGIKGPPDAVMLFCVQCRKLVPATTAQYQQAQAAAQAEGVGAIVKGPATPGSLPDVVRAGLFAVHDLWRHTVDLDMFTANPPKARQRVINEEIEKIEGKIRSARDAATKGALIGHSLGYYIDGSGVNLTPAGIDMARQIAAPDVPDLPPVDPTWAARHLADLKKKTAKETKPAKARAAAESMPMVCVCGEGPRAHLNAAGADVPCTAPGVKCSGYRQARRPTPVKVKAAAS